MHAGPLILFACRQTLRARARSLGILLVGTIGTASLATALTYAMYSRSRALDQISRMGVRLIAIAPTPTRQIAGVQRAAIRPLILTAADVRLLQWQIPSVERTSPVVIRSARLKAGDLSRIVTVVGCERTLFGMRRWPAIAGELWGDADDRSASRVVLLGARVAHDFFPNDEPLGSTVRLDGVRFVVRGILDERGEGADGINEDQQVYVPLTVAMRRLFHVDNYSAIIVEASDERNVQSTGAQSRALLQQRHHVQAAAVRVEEQKQAADALRSASTRLTFWLELIAAAGSVLAGGGVLMMIWSETADRTRDLAVLRAIGATRSNITGQLLMEAATRVTAATVAGIGCAVLLWMLAAPRAQLPIALDSRAACIAAGAGVAAQMIGAVFGTRHATRLEIIDGLHAQ